MPVSIPTPTRAPFRVMPGFGLSLGFTIFYLALIVLIPLSAVFLKTFTMTWEAFWAPSRRTAWSPRTSSVSAPR